MALSGATDPCNKVQLYRAKTAVQTANWGDGETIDSSSEIAVIPSSPSRRLVCIVLLGLLGAAAGWGAWHWQRAPHRDAPEGPSTDAPMAPSWFRDVTQGSGVDFRYRNGEEADRYTILESLGGGVALLDYDGDGLLDIYVTGGGQFTGAEGKEIKGYAGRLYRNLGGWKFRDVTADVGLDTAPFYTNGCLVGDHDNDGWPDLLVTGYGGMVLYHNESDGKGGRRFVNVTGPAGLTDTRWCTSAAWGDLSGKGRADLYVSRYVDWSFANDPKGAGSPRDVCAPQSFQPLPHSLYRNLGSKYEEMSSQAGLRRDGKGLGVALADLNADGRPDLYVANDAGDNFLYVNRGMGKLEECGAKAGVATDDHGHYNGSMGVDVGDFDGSGRASLWVTNFQGEYHALYRNLGGERFLYQTPAAGLSALGQTWVGFGTGFLDGDNDGWLDLMIVNGHVLRHPTGAPFEQRPVLLHNVEHQGRRFFREVSRQEGPFFTTPARGRGLAIGDLDNDGWPDVVISHTNGPVVLLRNDRPNQAGTHWLGVQLRGKDQRPIAGATVTLDVGGRQLTRFVKSGGSYLSSSDPRVLFGLGGAARVGRLSVRWPWGETQHWDGLAIDRYWELVENEPAPRDVRAIRP